MYPANLTEDDVITVGSSTKTDSIAGHSAYGAATVDLFAPGEQILVTYNDGGYRLANGTSFASPLVAVAMYRSLDPTMTAAEIKAEILRSATPRQAFAGRSVSGGRLSVSSLGGAGVTLRYAFAGLGRVTSPQVKPTVTMRGPAPAGDYTARVWLGMRYEGEVWAVSGVDLGLGGQAARTDDSGQFTVALPGAAFDQGVTLNPEFELPDGEYVLAVQVADASGTPLTRPFAAPLLVSQPVVSTPAPTGAGPGPGGAAPTGTGTATTTTPGGGAGTAPGGGGGAASPSAPTTGPGATGPAPTGAPTSASPTGGPTGPAPTGAPTSAGPTGAPTSAFPTGAGPTGAPTSAAPTSAAPPAATGTGTATTSSSPPGAGSPGAGPGGGSKTYPGTDVFRITRISPTQLSTAGGELVTIDGDIPANAAVRVGATGTATVLAGASGSLTFRAPARAAGVYDVVVHTPDRRSSTLSAALTYSDPGPGGPVPTPGTTTSTTSTTVTSTPGTSPAPTRGPSSPAAPSSSPVPSATSRPSATSGPSATSSPSGTSATPAPTTPRPSPVTTPSGLRLVRPGSGSPLAAVGPGVWNSGGCETGCAGSQL